MQKVKRVIQHSRNILMRSFKIAVPFVILTATLTFTLTTTTQKTSHAQFVPFAFWQEGFEPFTWTGLAGDNDWENTGNWSSGQVPGSGDVAKFRVGACLGANCNADMTANVDVLGVDIESGFLGTITQNSGVTVRVREDGWVQAGGTFVGGDSEVRLGSLKINGGSYTATSDFTRIVRGTEYIEVLRFETGASFTHNNGTLDIEYTGWRSNRDFDINLQQDMDVYNLNYSMNTSDPAACMKFNLNLAGGFNVANDFRMQTYGTEGVVYPASGEITIGGNLYADRAQNYCPSSADPHATLIFNNTSSDQEYSLPTGRCLTHVRVEKGATSLSPASGTTQFCSRDFTLVDGTFNSASGDARVNKLLIDGGTYNATSGTTLLNSPDHYVTVFRYLVGATFNHNNGLLDLRRSGNNYRYLDIDLAQDLNVYDLRYSVSSNAGGGVKWQHMNTGNIQVENDLWIEREGSNGTMEIDWVDLSVAGDIVADVGAASGAANLIINGTADQTISVDTGSLMDGTVTINKASGNLILLTNVDFDGAGQDMDIQDGDVLLNEFDLTIDDTLSMATGTTINKGCSSTLTVSGSPIAAGPYDNGTVLGSSSNPNITISDAEVTEGGNLEFTVTLSEGVCGSATNITFTTDDDLATIADSDYTDNDSTLIIPAGSTSGTITVVTTSDSTMEPDETLTLNLTGTDQGAITDSEGIGTILNDDDNGYIWTGDAGDNNWDTAGNWSGLAVPPTDGSVAVMFDDTCNDVPANCDVNTQTNVDVLGFWISASYPGTITQSSGDTITVGSDDWLQNGGTFFGGDSLIDVEKISINGGVFTSTSDELVVGLQVWSTALDGFEVEGGSFIHNNGEVRFDGWSTTNDEPSRILASSGVEFYNLTVDVSDANPSGGRDDVGVIVDPSATVNVLNNLKIIRGHLLQGELHLKGNLILECANPSDYLSCADMGGSTRIIIDGNTAQEYSVQDIGAISEVVVDTTGSFSPAAGTTQIQMSKFELISGSFTAPSGELLVGQHFTFPATDGFTINGGTFAHNNGTVVFNGSSSVNNIPLLASAPSGFDFYNLKIAVRDTNSSGGNDNVSMTFTNGHTFNVLNDLTIENGSFNGHLHLKGNLLLDCPGGITCSDKSGWGTIIFDGNVPQTYSVVGTAGGPQFSVNTSSTVTPLAGTTDLNLRKFELVSGSFTAPSNRFTVGYNFNTSSQTDGFTVSGGTFNHNNGEVYFNGNGGVGGGITNTAVISAPSGVNFYDFILDVRDSNPSSGNDGLAISIQAGHTITVENDLLLENGKIIGGEILLQGDLQTECAITSFQDCAGNSTVNITFNGNVDQSLNQAASSIVTNGLVSLNKPSGNVILQTNVSLDAAGQDLDIQDGDILMSGYDLTIDDTLSMATGTTINKGCSTLTVGGSPVAAGPYDNGTIIGTPAPNITIDDVQVLEGGNLVFTVTMSEPMCSGTTTINYTTDDDTATLAGSDYTDNDGSIDITVGNTTGTITVVTNGDSLPEGDETLFVNLTSTNNGTITDSQGVGTIEDDDVNVWTGDAGDNDWDNSANWSEGSVPGPSDVAFFNDVCNDVPANCDATTSGNVDVGGLWLGASYPGTLTQSSGDVMDIGTDGFNQSGGTFQAGDSNINIDGDFIIDGGTYNAGTATLRLVGSTARTVDVDSSQVYNLHYLVGANSTVFASDIEVLNEYYHSASGNSRINGTGTIHVAGDITCNAGIGGVATINLNGSGTQNFSGLQACQLPNITINATGTVNLSGTLHIPRDWTHVSGTVNPGTSVAYFSWGWAATSSTITTNGMSFNNMEFVKGGSTNVSLVGTVTAQGDVLFNAAGTDNQINGGVLEVEGDLTATAWDGGDATIRLTGSGTQTVTGSDGGMLPSIEFASSGTVNLAGEIEVEKDLTYTSGTVNAGTSEVHFVGGREAYIDVNSGFAFNNVLFNKSSNSADLYINTNMPIAGDLTMNMTQDITFMYGTGNIDLEGDFTLLDAPGSQANPAPSITFMGSGDQNIYRSGGEHRGNFIMNKASGSVIQHGALNMNYNGSGWSQDLILTDGTWDMQRYSITVNDQLIVSNSPDQAYINADCADLVVNGSTSDPGGGILGNVGAPDITVADETEPESNNLVFTIQQSKSCNIGMDANYTTDNDTAFASFDFTDNDGTVSIADGASSAAVTVVVTNDISVEPDESFTFTVTGSTKDANLVDPIAVGTIVDNDDNEYVWNGSAGDGNWNNATNWNKGSVPPNDGSVSIGFDNSCSGSDCNVTTPGNIDVLGIYLASSYTGTLTQGSGDTIDIGLNGFIQEGGTFQGGDSKIFIDGGVFALDGGTFTSTSDELEIYRYSVLSTEIELVRIDPTVTFNHNNGLLHTRPNTGVCGGTDFNFIIPTTLNLYNYKVSGKSAGCGTGDTWIFINTGSTIIVNNDLTLAGGGLVGEIELKGDLINDNSGGAWYDFRGSKNANVTFNGSGDQYYTSPANAAFTGITVDKTSGSVLPTNPGIDTAFPYLHILQGTFQAPSAELQLGFTATSVGDHIQGLRVDSGATFDHNNGLVRLVGDIANSTPGTIYFDINFNTATTFNDLTVDLDRYYNWEPVRLRALNLPIVVDGTFTYLKGDVRSDIEVKGDIYFSGNHNVGGPGGIIINGTTDQYITNSGDLPEGTITINKASGSVIALSNLTFDNTGQDLTITNGSLDLGAFSLTVVDVLTVDSSGDITCSGGSWTAGSTAGTGFPLSCP